MQLTVVAAAGATSATAVAATAAATAATAPAGDQVLTPLGCAAFNKHVLVELHAGFGVLDGCPKGLPDLR